jgi:hypothetical protein
VSSNSPHQLFFYKYQTYKSINEIYLFIFLSIISLETKIILRIQTKIENYKKENSNNFFRNYVLDGMLTS